MRLIILCDIIDAAISDADASSHNATNAMITSPGILSRRRPHSASIASEAGRSYFMPDLMRDYRPDIRSPAIEVGDFFSAQPAT